ncbi:unnamed protein product [Phytomonas sp. Hart1]|nr:unnamed protein product [Phytomonas sp. Hart1]|eukprot:CCW70875.1 unnamed protein product [Phytomonas sp. isolate Hart1]
MRRMMGFARGVGWNNSSGGEDLEPLAARPRRGISGQLPVGGPGEGPGWELRRGHHLQASAGLHSAIPTACGRLFNPQIYHEILHACCDHRWLLAIQRELIKDEEYMNSLREYGGSARDVRIISDSFQNDDEFMEKLVEKVKTDVKMSLTLCAVQESYERIRQKRDHHETQVVADDGRDPYAALRTGQQTGFGVQRTPL